MLKFDKFFSTKRVFESEDKSNTGNAVGAEAEGHLTHLEDLAIEKGKEGFAQAIEQITNFYNHLNGLSNNTKINLKIDGSPSLFWGIDPRPSWKVKGDQFFIATKTIFSKSREPKLVHSEKEIDELYVDADEGLRNTLKFVLPLLKAGYDGSGYIYNGDLLYSPEKPVGQKIINSELFLTFQPNTIEYAVPVDSQSELYNKIKNSTVGIIVHYKSKAQVNTVDVEDKNGKRWQKELVTLPMTGQDASSVVSKLNKVSGMFAEGSHMEPLNIKLDIGVRELYQKYYHDALEAMGGITTEFNKLYLSNTKVVELLKKYLNHTVRSGSNMFRFRTDDIYLNTKEYLNGFKHYAEAEMHKAAISPKLKAKGQANALIRKKDLINFIETNYTPLFDLIEVTYDLSQIKLIIHSILNRSVQPALKDLKSFTRIGNSYVPIGGEGHVLYIGTTANRVKIVDRIEFSKLNFEIGGKRKKDELPPESITEELIPTRIKTVGVCYGRWNPPHKGHKAAWQSAATCNSFYIGTNDTTQGSDDPLPYKVKVACMEAIWPEIKGHVFPEKNLLHLAAKVYKEHGENVDLKVYTDETWLSDLLIKYNGKEGVYGMYKFKSIEQVPTPRLSSATALRKAVRTNDKEAFAEAAGVPANTPIMVDGYEVNFFDIVAHYLSQYPEKVKRIKK